MPQFVRGEKVWWVNPWSNRVNYGIIKTTSGDYLKIQQYNVFLSPDEIMLLPRSFVRKFHPDGLSKLNEAIKLINIGRLQYNQKFFRSPTYKKKRCLPAWRRGYLHYKQLCKQYGVPISPKRAMPDLSEEW